MEINKFKYLFVTISAMTLILLSSNINAQELLKSEIQKDSILIGDQIEWNSTFSVPNDVDVVLDSLNNPVVSGVEVLIQRLDTLSYDDVCRKINSKAIITSFDSGSYILPERWAKFYKEGVLVDSLKIPSQWLDVNTIQIDTATYQMADIRPQIKYPITFKEAASWIGIGLLIIAFIVGIVLLVRKMISNFRNNKTIFGKPIIQDPPHITALRALDKIRKEKLWEQEDRQKEFYTEVTDAIRVYMEGRFNIQAVESTSNEIFSSLAKEKLPQREYMELKELFELADLVKFAKYSTTKEEGENAIPVAVRFVNTTFIQELEEEIKDGK